MPAKLLSSVDQLPEPLRRFMDRLADEQKLLLVLKRELYSGDWHAMSTDLRNRLEGKPYVFKLGERIEEDLKRIDQMRQLETHYQVDLSDFLAGLDDLKTETGP